MSTYFISNVDTYLGEALLDTFQAVPDISLVVSQKTPHDIPGVSKVISKAKPRQFKKHISRCDVIIYDLMTADLEEVEEVVKELKVQEFEGEKTLIAISSVLTWGNTKPKMVPRGPDDPETENEEEEEAPLEGDEEAEKPIKYKRLPFEESDYTLRKAPEKYLRHKSLETLILSTGMNKPNLNVYVVCAGVLYGKGESILNYHCRSAWLEDPYELPYIGEGLNMIPTIHISDLGRYVKHVLAVHPDTHYLFGIDATPDTTQKNLVSAISNGLGSGSVASIEASQEEWGETLSLDVQMKPGIFTSKIRGEDDEEEEEEEEEEDEDEYGSDEERPPKVPKPKLEWQYLAGIPGNIQKINEEFNSRRGLDPIKVFISGPPGSGKSHFGAQLAKHYNIPHIQIGEVSESAKNLQNDLGESIREKLDELRDEMADEINGNLGEDEEEVDRTTLKPRIPDDLLVQAYKWRLSANQCRNRGYILDGWPKNQEFTNKLFMKPEELDEDEEPPEEEKMVLDEGLLPGSVVVLSGGIVEIKQRLKELAENSISGTHYNDTDMDRRFKLYVDANLSEKGDLAICDFFEQHTVDVFDQPCMELEKDVFESLQIFIERKGRPFNYMTAVDKLEVTRIDEFNVGESKKAKEIRADNRKREAMEKETRTKQELHGQMRIDQHKQQERDLLETKSQPLRQYLLDNIVPILTDGLLHVCKSEPDDPVEALAEYLFKHYQEVPRPDPAQP